MVTPMSAAHLQGSDPFVWVWFIVLFILPALGYAVWFVAERRK